jgi:ABC-type lipoprotein export system ATPase subunit
MPDQQSLIVLKDVSKQYEIGKKGSVPAVHNINLQVTQGEFVVITGRSGCGKTTLLNLISGLTRPSSGVVTLEGIEVWKLPDREQALLRNRKIGFIFQFPSLMPALTVMENVLLPSFVERSDQRNQQQRRVHELLEQVGLADKLESYPRQLSAGQQQRVVIARALINKPDVLLADEPTSNLDERTEQEIMALIRQVHQEQGITVLLVTHSTELIHFGSRSVRMAGGEIVGGSNLSPIEAYARDLAEATSF